MYLGISNYSGKISHDSHLVIPKLIIIDYHNVSKILIQVVAYTMRLIYIF